MSTNPQTYAVTTVSNDRLRIFQRAANAEKMIELLFHYRDEGRYLLHGFVVMPDHLHVLLTPSPQQTIERCIQMPEGRLFIRYSRKLQGRHLATRIPRTPRA